MDCADILDMGHNTSGIYEIWPVNRVIGEKPVYVYCDMETNGGGWTVSVFDFFSNCEKFSHLNGKRFICKNTEIILKT